MKKEAEEKAKAENETKPETGKAENKTEKADKGKKATVVTLKEPIEAKEEKLGPRILTGEKLTASQEK